MAAARRRKMIGHRRRVEDEGDEEGGPDAVDVEDDSLSEGSIATDDDDAAEDSDTSNIDEASPTSLNPRKPANGGPKSGGRLPASQKAHVANAGASNGQVTDTDVMLRGLSIADKAGATEEIHFDEVVPSPTKSPSAPIVVSSASINRQPPGERRRQEHEDYKRRRDEDPAFVPNRGSFFMHDHRHAGPAANGFRPFGRGRGRGGRGGFGGLFTPINPHVHHPSDPTTNSPWTHDMHEAVAESSNRRSRQIPRDEGPANGNGVIPTCEPTSTPINRTLSTEKHIGNAPVRVMLPDMSAPKVFAGMPVKQYTKLPDHRPPLRRDKPVRISLPDHPPRYIYPAVDRSFIFIPRAMRPNQQQRGRGRPRSGLGSTGGFSRRTSIFGGSYYGSAYSPSIALSRRSSVAHERDFLFSPTGSVISRPPLPAADTSRPVVRLPPAPRPDAPPAATAARPADASVQGEQLPAVPSEVSINDLPPPQTHPLPQRPATQESRQTSIPMHQPRPKKNISVADIDSPTLAQGPQNYPVFHQQVPMQMANGMHHESHSRQPSYPSRHSAGTPLSQIPERAIHAAPFQPTVYGQPPNYYNQQPYQPPQPQPNYYYGPGYSGPGMATSGAPPPPPPPAFVPPMQHGMPGSFAPQPHPDPHAAAGQPGSNLVAQEVNGMVYYYDASQLPPVNTYPPYSAPQGFQSNVMGMGGMVTPSPDGYYYPQPAPGMVYYSQ
ncbi:CASC3/Barentsz eIF4AIII binding-domain-containing protein [Stachybotrys elegans]|uniref:CASC3/Barentsz eIF4AIII binding-domain-containing protein n=1 Tax=Stachybotrys elegans TaxID=80388 RepID=A0A8K0SZB8_9HYPO|nr:CASC3/Barentsz eIF4AIII binding-domain-containing protein [Stachybotrys elegans]